jgi:ribonuclease HI
MTLASEKALERLAELAGSGVSIASALEMLSQHEAVLRMLSKAYPGIDEDAIEKALKDAAIILANLLKFAGVKNEPAAKEKTETARDSGIPPACTETDAISDHDKVKVFVDGASKGNPGEAAVGIVITTIDGQVICEEARYIGLATNNVAEYVALIAALKILLNQKRVPEAYFFSDSALMVNQINGVFKVKNTGLMPLISEAQALRRQLPRFQIIHVPREQNRRADELASLAIKQARDAAPI